MENEKRKLFSFFVLTAPSISLREQLDDVKGLVSMLLQGVKNTIILQ